MTTGESPFLNKLEAAARRPSSIGDDTGKLSSYVLGEQLGRGGMGTVVAAHDPRIGREVAVKRMSADDPDAATVERFVREAKIQARLEHPAIVPVHELGVDVDGLPYFTMKRLVGTTLAEMLAAGSATQKRMLRALVEVCNAIDLAHTRGIVHRDLKPANIMLGHFGEVYVIDWGVARILDDDFPDAPSGAFSSGSLTQAGTIIGTAGYMAPEQMRGEPASTAADVYALGAILFEILCGEPLRHQAGAATPPTSLIAGSTLRDPGQATRIAETPAARRPDRPIAPELDRACFSALSEDPAKRPTARELGELIQRWLDGDRDVEQRRALAAEQLDSARRALANPASRGEAVRAAGRALALDPTNEEASDLVAQLLVTPPAVEPPELSTALATEERAIVAENGRRGFYAFCALLVGFAPVPLLLAVRDRWMYAFVLVAILGNMAMSRFIVNAKGRLELVMTFLLALAFSQAASPFILTPMLICAMVPSLSQIPWINDRRWLIVGWAIATGVAPFLAEAAGLFHTTWWSNTHGVTTYSGIFDQSGSAGAGVTLFGDLAFLAVIALYMHQLAADRRAAVRQVHVQNWHLRQLLAPGVITSRLR